MVDGHPYRRAAGVAGELPCPACGGALLARDSAGVASLECAGCLGTWMPAAAWSELAVDPRAQEQLLERLAPGGGVAPGGPLACPCCAAPLSRQPLAGPASPPLDLCRAHGLWFGRGQLRQALAHIASGAVAGELEARRRAELAAAVLELEARPRRGLFDRLLGLLTRRVRTLR